MVHSKEKGSEFERKMCHVLSLWVSENRRDDIFWRAAMSGGRATLRSRKGRGQARCDHHAGDISATSREGNDFLDVFLIECKHYKDLKIWGWVYGHRKHLDDIWDKPLRESREAGKTVMVIAKQNNKPELVLTTVEGHRYLDVACKGQMPVRATFVREKQIVFVLFLQDLLVRGKWSRMVRYFRDEGMLKTEIHQRPLSRNRF